MKKIIASILAIAMVLSMFTMVFSANTEEQTNYSEYVEEINDLIDTLLEVGPMMLVDNILFDANRADAYITTNSNQRIGVVMNLGGAVWNSTVYSDIARYDDRFDEIVDYWDDMDEDDGYPDKIKDYESGKLVGEEPVAPVYPYGGVDLSKLFPVESEADFLAILAESDAINAVAQAWGYTDILAAVKALYYADGQTNGETTTEQLVNWSSELPQEIREKYLNSAGKKFLEVKNEYGDKIQTTTDSMNAVIDWIKANNRTDLLPQKTNRPVKEVAYSDTLEVFDMLMAYVTSAAYFGTHADADWFSGEFNLRRTIIYKTAIQAAKDFIAALRSMVTAANCPYAEELKLYTDFANEVNNNVAYNGEDVYNASYGINPYPVVNLKAAYGIESELGILGGYQWFSFAEIAAHSEEAAQLLTELQSQLRAASLFNVNGVLYAEFEGKVEDLYATFEDLCWELVGPTEEEIAANAFDYKAALAAVMELLQVEALYEVYIEENIPLYAQTVENISTIYNLRGQIDYARRLLDHVGYGDGNNGNFWVDVIAGFLKGTAVESKNAAGEQMLVYSVDDADYDRALKIMNPFQKLKGLSADAIHAFVDNIEANIAALVPAAGQKITAAEVAEGLALYKKAGNLLSYYSEYTTDNLGIDPEDNSNIIPGYDTLKVLYTQLSNMLPSNDGVATAELPLDIVYLRAYPQVNYDYIHAIYGWESTHDQWGSYELKASTFEYALEFTPVAYAYLSLLPEVEAAIELMEAYIAKKLNTEAPDLGGYPVDELVAAMDKYDFLTYRAMFVDGLDADDDDCKLYFYLLTGHGTEATFVTGLNSDEASHENGQYVQATDKNGNPVWKESWNQTQGKHYVLDENGNKIPVYSSTPVVVYDVEFGDGSFLDIVMGDPVSEDDLAYDYAVRNYAYFYSVYDYIRDVYATEWHDELGETGVYVGHYFNKYEYANGDKLDFSGDFSILDVTVGTKEALIKELIAELEAAAALLCVNVTDRIAMFQWVNEELAEIFELTIDGEKANYIISEQPKTEYGKAANYVEGELKNLADAMSALNKLIDRYYQVKVNGQWVDYTNRATPAQLEAAYEDVQEVLYKLFTAKGAACLDVFFAQIDLTLTAKVYGNKNSVKDVQDALDAHVRSIKKYFPAESEMRPYEYFAWTLRAVANYSEAANIYSLDNDYFYINFYKAFDKAVNGVNAIVTGQYPTALREDAAKLAFFANDIRDGVAEGTFPLVLNPLTGKMEPLNWNAYNMPLWYALELTTYLSNYVAVAAEQHSSALNALKAEVLAPVMEEAETIQTAFLAAPGRLVRAYETAEVVMANYKDGALYIYTAEEIQAAADALAATVELAKAELGDAVYTVEDVLALVDEIVATAEARATGLAVDLKDLRVAANETKTDIAAGAYNQGNYISKLVVSANSILKSLANVKLADAELYTPASYEAYEAAYNTLMDAVNVETEVDVTIAEALAAFKAAEAALVTIESATGAMYEAAKAAYEAALTVDGSKYTAESYAAFEAAVAALKAAIDNYAGDAELQAAIVNVKVAEVQLVVAPIDEVGTLDD